MTSVDHYIQTFPEEVQIILQKIRICVFDNAPGVVEGFGYGMPAYKTNGRPLIYFAGFKHHIGLYATPSGHRAFSEELSKYKQGKGSVQFPLDQPMPYDLIARIIAFRYTENKG